MQTHNLKTINPYFKEVWDGNKTFEVRLNDRNFKRGDEVVLQEYGYEYGLSGREILCKITYVLENFAAIDHDFVVFSIIVIEKQVK